MAHTTKITLPFFADRGDERDCPTGPDLRRVEGLNQSDQCSQSCRIVCYSGSTQSRTLTIDHHVCSFRKDCVEVRREDKQRVFSLSAEKTDDISFTICMKIRQTEFGKTRGEITCAFLFF